MTTYISLPDAKISLAQNHEHVQDDYFFLFLY